MAYKQDLGDRYVIIGQDGTPIPIPKQGLSPEQSAQIQAIPDLPFGSPGQQPVPTPEGGLDFAGTQPMAPMTMDTRRLRVAQDVAAPKYVGGGLAPFAQETQQIAKDVSAQGLPPMPARPDLAEVRKQAEAQGGGPIFSSKVGELQSRLRASDFERSQAEEKRQLDVAAQEEQLQTMRDDIRNYKINSDTIFGLKRPLTKQEQGERVRKAIAGAEQSTTGDLVDVKIPEDASPEERRKLLAAQAIKGAQKIRETKAAATKEASEAEVTSGRGVASTIGLIISAALQSYASGLAGRDPNAGMALIDNFINQKMSMQKAELAKRQDLAQGQVNFLGEMKSRFRDERAAELATRSMLQESMAAEMARIQQTVKDADDQQRLDGMRQQALGEAQRLGLQARGLELEARKAMSEQAYRRELLGLERAKAEREKLPKDIRVPGMDFSGEKMPTDDDAKVTNKARGQVADAIRNIDALNEYVFGPEGVGYEVFSTREAKLAKAKMRDIQLALKSEDMKNLGVLTGPDLELLEDITSKDPTGFFTTENQMLLQDLRQRVLNGFLRASRQRGYTERELQPFEGGEAVR